MGVFLTKFSAYIEAFILYIAIFFSQVLLRAVSTGIDTALPEEAVTFSVSSLLLTLFIYCIPSLVIIWLLLYRRRKPEYRLKKPVKHDLFSGLISLPCLLTIGIAVSIISILTGAAPTQPPPSPASIAGWITLCVFCLFSAYLEESFFRFYLLSKREELNLNAPLALVISAVLFGICHICDGFWGFVNAVLSGLFLGFMFIRYKTLHGIAVAHWLYNLTAFILMRTSL